MPPRVSKYMTSEVVTADENDNLARIRNLMIRYGIGRVVIVSSKSGGKVVGIISRSDFVRIMYNRKRMYRPLTDILAKEIMSTPVYSIRPTRAIKRAAHIMLTRKIGSLVVMDIVNGVEELKGIITKTDIVRAYAENYKGVHSVEDMMITDDLPIVHPQHSFFYVAEVVGEHGRAIVVDNGKVVGVITKADIMYSNIFPLARTGAKFVKRAGITGRGLPGVVRIYTIPVAYDIMTPNPITVSPAEDLAEASRIMITNGISTLPVVDDSGRLVGLVTKKEVLKAVRKG